ncbi:hypothetical protein J3E72DRAFT_353450 [Bipolaris maydis]|uniref:uncharacterized protein n=1 Tax=Cochliobolus heterostrophus TaxID=5016 RepID=UPI0024D04DFD|nr:hypothetical protein J3E73DRAFT_336813 [Bipolaris maydis]KAJ5056189.1 hypothetical protein J3E74DRAFT_378538 [Bipolaris maydis]KAJ6193935.1 hypothetical protein J3E72DRAFT_353450 [Bipolaris maydis]KAJ6211932.1 hypothetical protein PSV09DRAFT_2283363 [Bipolaris maydis]KAJ6267142.1 hypothetical protein PSV08DRAFT_329923 [Bipolaris maydis]
MDYSANLSGRHGGGVDPETGVFVHVQSYQQSYYPNQSSHCGGGSYDPNKPAVTISAVPLVYNQPPPRPQPTFASQASTVYDSQPYQHFQPPPPQHQQQYQVDSRPGFITQLCNCFR